MPLSDHELKALAIELAAAMPAPPLEHCLREELANILSQELDARRVEIVPSTGELLDVEAMELARLFQRATLTQQAAFTALADVIRAQL